MGPFAVILPAAGRSTRFGGPNRKKIYADLEGRAVWLRAAEAFLNRADVAQVLLAIHPEDRDLFESRYRPNVAFLGIRVLEGGAERHETVAKALALVDPACEFVAVHDAARPCVPGDLIDRVFDAARARGAAIPGVPVADTLKRVGPDRLVSETVPRAGLFGVQTPQAFRLDLLVRAYAGLEAGGPAPTDDAMLVEALGHACEVVDGSPLNLKITTAVDLQLASAILRGSARPEPARPARPFDDEI